MSLNSLSLKRLFFIIVALPGMLAWSDDWFDQSNPVFEQHGISLYGSLKQGGLLLGTAQSTQGITLLNRDIPIDESGQFVFGLGRDTPAVLPMQVKQRDGREYLISLPVEQRQYRLQRIEGVDEKYVRELSEALKARTKKEAAQVWQARQTLRKSWDFLQGFDWPAQGPVTGVYGSQRIFNGVPKRPHYGLDIAAPIGTPVVAPAPGEVTLAHQGMYYSGGTLILDHGWGVSSTFIHLSKILVKTGEQIKAGQTIAEIGATGRATGPHLDWRINWFNQRLDPALVLPAKQ